MCCAAVLVNSVFEYARMHACSSSFGVEFGRWLEGGDTSIWFLYDTNGEYAAVIKDDVIAELLSSSSVRFMYSIRVVSAFVFPCMN